ncbi:MAG: chromate transporter, partial [Oscillospiraceae bacterium]|nr:chromate transporter [Oscillospiraceae bacterium]
GVIATNAGTYVGYKAAGIPGAVAAAVGVVTPSFFIILIIARVLKSAMTVPIVVNAFSGVRAAVAALVLSALISLFKNGVKNKVQFMVFAAAFVLAAVFDISPVAVVVAAVMLGILLETLGVKS